MVFAEKIHRSENPQPFSSKQEENKRSRTYDLKQADGSLPPTPNHESAIREEREEVFAEAYPFCNSKSGILGFGGREKIVYGSERREKWKKEGSDEREQVFGIGGKGADTRHCRTGKEIYLFCTLSLSLIWINYTWYMNVSTFPTPCLPDEVTTDDAFARECWLEKNATPTTIIDTVAATMTWDLALTRGLLVG